MYGFRPRQLIDLIPWLNTTESLSLPSSFTTHMHELYKVISDKIKQNNFDYKLQAIVRKKFKTFDIGDHVMVRIILNGFPGGLLKNYMLVVLDRSKS